MKPGNDNASSRGIEISTLERGYDAGRQAARHLDQLSEMAMPRDRQDAWRVAGHWLERRRMEARDKPRPQHHRDVPLVRSLVSSGLFAAFRAGYMAGLCAALNERYKATPMSTDEATWMGVARGHAMVYGRTWPRTSSPSQVSSVALSDALSDTTGASDAGGMAEVSRQGQAFLRGVAVGAAEGAETYLKHSGRGHLRVVTAPISGDAPPLKRRRKKVVLKRVKNGASA